MCSVDEIKVQFEQRKPPPLKSPYFKIMQFRPTLNAVFNFFNEKQNNVPHEVVTKPNNQLYRDHL